MPGREWRHKRQRLRPLQDEWLSPSECSPWVIRDLRRSYELEAADLPLDATAAAPAPSLTLHGRRKPAEGEKLGPALLMSEVIRCQRRSPTARI